MKGEHTGIFLERSTYSQFIYFSHGEQGGSRRREQTTNSMRSFDSNNKLKHVRK